MSFHSKSGAVPGILLSRGRLQPYDCPAAGTTDFVKASSLVTAWFPRLACVGALNPCLALRHSSSSFGSCAARALLFCPATRNWNIGTQPVLSTGGLCSPRRENQTACDSLDYLGPQLGRWDKLDEWSAFRTSELQSHLMPGGIRAASLKRPKSQI